MAAFFLLLASSLSPSFFFLSLFVYPVLDGPLSSKWQLMVRKYEEKMILHGCNAMAMLCVDIHYCCYLYNSS